jgi:hypothetical protein
MSTEQTTTFRKDGSVHVQVIDPETNKYLGPVADVYFSKDEKKHRIETPKPFEAKIANFFGKDYVDKS